MRILQIHTQFESGGIEAVICNLANEMAITQDVTVCSIFKPSPNAVYWNKILPSVKKITLGKSSKGFSIREIFSIYKTIKRGHYDVVHMHGCFYYYFFTICLLFSKIKFVYTIHSDAQMENVSWDAKIFPIKRFFFKKRWVHPVCISEVSQKSFVSLYHSNARVIYNGIASPTISDVSGFIKSYKITPETKVFIHVGRITKAKNQEVLCRVFKKLIARNEDVVLLIVGAKEDKLIWNEIEQYLGTRIFYIGERSDVPSLLAYCDAMCLPSIWEGLPMILLETLAVGCVPICSPVGGMVDVITPGENGILSNSSSEKDYYQAVCSFLQLTNEEITRMKEQGLNTFKRYMIQNVVKEYMDLYKK